MNEWWESEYDCEQWAESSPEFLTVTLSLRVPKDSLELSIAPEQKETLRPICEVLAMLESQPFFALDTDGQTKIWERYLPYAHALFLHSGGMSGWAGQLSWIRDFNHPHASVREAWENYCAIKNLVADR